MLDEDKLAEIEALRAEARPTRRAVAPALEAILYEPLKVLDHGFVRVVDYMGDDAGDRAGGARLLRPRHQAGQRATAG